MKSMETFYYLLTFGEESEGKWWNDLQECKSHQDCVDALPEKAKRKNYLGYDMIEVNRGDFYATSWVSAQCDMPSNAKLIVSEDRSHFEVVPT